MILSFIQKIRDLGAQHLSKEEKGITQFYNLMIFATLLFNFILIGLVWNIQLGNEYLALAVLYALINLLCLYLNAKGNIYITRLIVAAAAALLICCWHVSVGGFFGQGGCIVAVGILAYISLGNAPRYRKFIPFIVYIPFAISLLYVYGFGELRYPRDWKYDEIAIFMINVVCMLGLLHYTEKQNGKIDNELIQKNGILENKRTELKRFVYIASHDLKAPLINISSLAQLIEKDIKNDNASAALEKLEYARSGAAQMTLLVERVLELSDFKAKKTAVHQSISLEKVVEKALLNLMKYTEDRNAVVEYEMLPDFYCNETEFIMLFQNFIQNGIKYNESVTPHITISAYTTAKHLTITIKDNGIGIKKADHDKIFGFYSRLDNARSYKGTGIGLGMCKEIIDNHGGSIKVDSVVGLGTSFAISFPIGKVVPVEKEVTLA